MLSRAGRILTQQASHDTPVESVTFGRCRWRLPHWVAPIDKLLRLTDRIVTGVCVLLVRPSRLVRSAIVLKAATLFRLHRALKTRKYRLLLSPTVRSKPGPRGPSQDVVAAVVDEEP